MRATGNLCAADEAFKEGQPEENLRGIDRYFATVELVNRLDVPTGGEPVWSFLFFRCHN